ncbi:Slam-dependent surface lipoprotein [Avibacterium paragallinarum]|nr:Slam-dependent surface lipoprotein [Avibacterium paragallinarum]
MTKTHRNDANKTGSIPILKKEKSMKNISLKMTALSVTLFACLTAQGAVTSGISNGNADLSVANPSAAHNGWFHSDEGGLPGVEVKGATSKVTSFKSLTKITKNTQWMRAFGGVDNDGVVVLKMNNMPSWVLGFHNKLGNFAFKKVGEQELYYGEWVARDADATKDRVVYYAGNDKTVALPKGGKATYTVTGINNNNDLNKGVLKGQFNADFEKGTLEGTMVRRDLEIEIDAKINKQNASFKGDAFANGVVDGTTSGQFFGKDAAALAGYAKFADNKYDTAFGGTKNQ